MKVNGFVQCKNGYSLFIKKNSGLIITIVAVYVDDILISGSDLSAIEEIKVYLHFMFSIKDRFLELFFGSRSKLLCRWNNSHSEKAQPRTPQGFFSPWYEASCYSFTFELESIK